MALGLLGRKVGMTQVFDAKGRAVPVTVIEAGPCPVVQRKTAAKEGYDAVQLGFGPAPKPARLPKPLKGHFARARVAPARHLREFRVAPDADLAPGAALTVALFAAGEQVDVTGVTKGKGFQGGVRRRGYRGGPETHGSMFHRAPGSIGASSFPSRVFRGHHMPGRMGGARQTTRHLEVVRVLPEQNLLLVRGAVPGPAGGLVAVRKAG
jgi:large subunit ribosomal protein L3